MTWNLQPSGVTNQGTYTPDNLLCGEFDIVTKQVIIKAGQNLVRGTILEALTGADAGKYKAVQTDANALYVLVEDVDATAGDKVTGAYITGQFNAQRVTLGVGATLAGVRAALEPRSVFLMDTISAT